MGSLPRFALRSCVCVVSGARAEGKSDHRPEFAVADLILRIEDVTREVGERVRTRAFAGVSVALPKAEFVALIGPSGSGKSPS